MSKMREIKGRMKSINETKQITKAMKLMSAAKLKKARQQLENTLPFFKSIELTMADILCHSSDLESKYFIDTQNPKESPKRAYIILSGDKGLAGGYNSNIFKLSQAHIGDRKDSLLFVGGHVGNTFFKKKGYNVCDDFLYPIQNPTVSRAREIADIVLDYYNRGAIDEIYLIYTYMISNLSLEPRVIQLLPLELEELRRILGVEESCHIHQNTDASMNYEPSPLAVFDVLVPQYIKGLIYCAFVESFTSEQIARMTAMDNATANAEEMIDMLNLYYNRARQSAITQEISEIVGGAAVLE
jgi:F-type H+-transporting ATPase subunit gamma